MLTVGELQERFGIHGVVRVEPGHGGLTRIVVSGDLSSGEIYLHGGHVTQFQPRGARPVLFLSRASRFEADKAIRGGIPIVFPWFGNRADDPTAPAHGFARTLPWEIESIDHRTDASVRMVLTLAANQDTLKLWPHEFTLRLTVIFAKALDVTLETRNKSTEAVDFEQALHTYLHVGDVRQATVKGLGGVDYLDKVDGLKRKTQTDDLVVLHGETDRVYMHTRGDCIVGDPSLNRSIAVEKEGSDTTVVWNPWIAKAKAMSDLDKDEWPGLLCVETANVGESKVHLAAGATHRMRPACIWYSGLVQDGWPREVSSRR